MKVDKAHAHNRARIRHIKLPPADSKPLQFSLRRMGSTPDTLHDVLAAPRDNDRVVHLENAMYGTNGNGSQW